MRINLPRISNKTFCLLYLGALFIFAVKAQAQQAEEITFAHEGLTVFGTLLLPEGEGPHPTLIIGPGSGPNDRDGTITLVGPNVDCLYPELVGQTLRPYKQLAEALADSGYAVLRYDKLEYTYTTGLGTITFPKLWLPVESALNYVKTRDDVDTTRIVLIGHSEGSYLIPYIARGRDDVQALISVAGARTPFDTLLTTQLVDFATWCDGDVALAELQSSQILEYYNLVRSGSWPPALPPLFGVGPGVWKDYIDVIDSTAINYNLAALPSLFLGMELDVNVPPIELQRLQNDVSIPADFWSLPELNHYMTPMNNPNVSLSLADTIVYWLKQLPVVTSTTQASGHGPSFSAYPNPFSHTLSVKWADAPGSAEYHISLRDALGREVLRAASLPAHATETTLQHLAPLSPGLYYLEWSNGQQRQVIKLVKER